MKWHLDLTSVRGGEPETAVESEGAEGARKETAEEEERAEEKVGAKVGGTNSTALHSRHSLFRNRKPSYCSFLHRKCSNRNCMNRKRHRRCNCHRLHTRWTLR